MFKYILFQAARTTLNTLCLSPAPSPERCQELIEQHNRRAKPEWEREGQEFTERQRQCEIIYKELIRASYTPPPEDLQVIPQYIAAEFDKIFRKHYSSPEKYLLFGRTDDDALEVQDGYGLEVATVLGNHMGRYGARAQLFLRKIYGRAAPLPLLSIAFAAAAWGTCSSRYYQEQITTVSLAALSSFSNFAHSHSSVSFTPGLNPSHRSLPAKVMISHMLSTGTYGLSQTRSWS